MSNRRSLAWAVCALSFLGSTAHAQSTTTSGGAPAPVEISPFVSAASGDATGVGATIRWPVLAKLGLEVDTEFRSGELRALQSSVNAVYDLPAVKRVTPYAVGGVGFERYGLVDFYGGGFIPRRSTTLAFNLGGGVRVAITDCWGFRADVRYSVPQADRAPERLRVFWGATVGLGKR